ncbi:MAG: hypothetical protein EB078_08575 [Proteobacteria bacterium]|nr:hypothetical protein [Pseudomonadota bacterium]NDD04947.1 hypothetical protein [Pseudomonadota bacterium]
MPTENKKRLENDPDFIAIKRFDYSLKKLLIRYPEGCPDRIIANALLITEEDVEDLYSSTVLKLRKMMGTEDEDQK